MGVLAGVTIWPLLKKEKQQKNTFCYKGGMINAYGNDHAILTKHIFTLLLRVLGVEYCGVHFPPTHKQ